MSAAITIHFRNPNVTTRCIESLLEDGWSPVLVWDNSADGGVSVQSLVLRYGNDPRVLLVQQPLNLGFGKGMNAALAELGRREYVGPVLLVNNDACVLTGLREALHARLGDMKENVLMSPRIRSRGGVQGWMFYHRWFALLTSRRLFGSFPYLSGCCLFVARFQNALPLFDESFFMYGEDCELSWRWRREKKKILLLDEVLVEHEGSASSGMASEVYERSLVRAHWLLAEKFAETSFELFAMRASRLPTLMARACVRAARYQSLLPLLALCEIQLFANSFANDHRARR